MKYIKYLLYIIGCLTLLGILYFQFIIQKSVKNVVAETIKISQDNTRDGQRLSYLGNYALKYAEQHNNHPAVSMEDILSIAPLSELDKTQAKTMTEYTLRQNPQTLKLAFSLCTPVFSKTLPEKDSNVWRWTIASYPGGEKNSYKLCLWFIEP
jgi:hypothetical protein